MPLKQPTKIDSKKTETKSSTVTSPRKNKLAAVAPSTKGAQTTKSQKKSKQPTTEQATENIVINEGKQAPGSSGKEGATVIDQNQTNDAVNIDVTQMETNADETMKFSIMNSPQKPLEPFMTEEDSPMRSTKSKELNDKINKTVIEMSSIQEKEPIQSPRRSVKGKNDTNTFDLKEVKKQPKQAAAAKTKTAQSKTQDTKQSPRKQPAAKSPAKKKQIQPVTEEEALQAFVTPPPKQIHETKPDQAPTEEKTEAKPVEQPEVKPVMQTEPKQAEKIETPKKTETKPEVKPEIKPAEKIESPKPMKTKTVKKAQNVTPRKTIVVPTNAAKHPLVPTVSELGLKNKTGKIPKYKFGVCKLQRNHPIDKKMEMERSKSVENGQYMLFCGWKMRKVEKLEPTEFDAQKPTVGKTSATPRANKMKTVQTVDNKMRKSIEFHSKKLGLGKMSVTPRANSKKPKMNTQKPKSASVHRKSIDAKGFQTLESPITKKIISENHESEEEDTISEASVDSVILKYRDRCKEDKIFEDSYITHEFKEHDMTKILDPQCVDYKVLAKIVNKIAVKQHVQASYDSYLIDVQKEKEKNEDITAN